VSFSAIRSVSLELSKGGKEKFTSSHPESASPFNLPLRNLLPTPTKPVKLTNIRKQKAADLTSAIYSDEACGRYRKRNVINAQKKKYDSGLRISISTLALYLQDDGEEVCAETSKGDTFRGLCSRQYTCQNSSQFGYEMLTGNMKSTLAQDSVKDSLVGSHVRKL
jgi:hypothetical protein